MGQKHTIITADQPLYNRGKELALTNPKFESVIFLMGGLRICFNLLKNIDQQMDSARLDDLWTEGDIYAANTTQTMLGGNAYYRAVRAHQVTHEALWYLKWLIFKKSHGWVNMGMKMMWQLKSSPKVWVRCLEAQQR